MSARAKARTRSPGAKKRRTTAAGRRAMRKNGAKGGRPRDKLPQKSLDKLGAPPADAKGLREWNARVLAEVQWLCLSGAISNELATSIRAGAKSIDAALPVKPSSSSDPADDDEDDDEEGGPELAASPAIGGLRVG